MTDSAGVEAGAAPYPQSLGGGVAALQNLFGQGLFSFPAGAHPQDYAAGTGAHAWITPTAVGATSLAGVGPHQLGFWASSADGTPGATSQAIVIDVHPAAMDLAWVRWEPLASGAFFAAWTSHQGDVDLRTVTAASAEVVSLLTAADRLDAGLADARRAGTEPTAAIRGAASGSYVFQIDRLREGLGWVTRGTAAPGGVAGDGVASWVPFLGDGPASGVPAAVRQLRANLISTFSGLAGHSPHEVLQRVLSGAAFTLSPDGTPDRGMTQHGALTQGSRLGGRTPVGFTFVLDYSDPVLTVDSHIRGDVFDPTVWTRLNVLVQRRWAADLEVFMARAAAAVSAYSSTLSDIARHFRAGSRGVSPPAPEAGPRSPGGDPPAGVSGGSPGGAGPGPAPTAPGSQGGVRTPPGEGGSDASPPADEVGPSTFAVVPLARSTGQAAPPDGAPPSAETGSVTGPVTFELGGARASTAGTAGGLDGFVDAGSVAAGFPSAGASGTVGPFVLGALPASGRTSRGDVPGAAAGFADDDADVSGLDDRASGPLVIGARATALSTNLDARLPASPHAVRLRLTGLGTPVTTGLSGPGPGGLVGGIAFGGDHGLPAQGPSGSMVAAGRATPAPYAATTGTPAGPPVLSSPGGLNGPGSSVARRAGRRTWLAEDERIWAGDASSAPPSSIGRRSPSSATHSAPTAVGLDRVDREEQVGSSDPAVFRRMTADRHDD